MNVGFLQTISSDQQTKIPCRVAESFPDIDSAFPTVKMGCRIKTINRPIVELNAVLLAKDARPLTRITYDLVSFLLFASGRGFH